MAFKTKVVKRNLDVKNIIINGGMEFAQRRVPSTAMTTANDYYSLDRYKLKMAGGATAGTSNRALWTPNDRGLHALQTNFTPTISSHRIDIAQYIESKNVRHLEGEKASFGFWVYSGSATEVIYQVRTPTVEDNFSSVDANMFDGTLVVPSLNTWHFLEIPNMLMTSDIVRGLEIFIGFQNMSVLNVDVQHFTTQWMFHEGEETVPFNRFGDNYEEELVACQRYLEKSYDIDTDIGNATSVGARTKRCLSQTSSGHVFDNIDFKVTKRTIPLHNVYATQSSLLDRMRNVTNNNNLEILYKNANENGFYVQNNNTLTSGSFYEWHWAVEAEL